MNKEMPPSKAQLISLLAEKDKEIEDLTAEVERLTKDYTTALRRERSTYDQKTRNYKKLKQAETRITDLKAALEKYGDHINEVYKNMCGCGFTKALKGGK